MYHLATLHTSTSMTTCCAAESCVSTRHDTTAVVGTYDQSPQLTKALLNTICSCSLWLQTAAWETARLRVRACSMAAENDALKNHVAQLMHQISNMDRSVQVLKLS